MMLGKRERPPMRRTMSMTGITVDLEIGTEPEPSDYKAKDNTMIDESFNYHQYSESRISGEGFERERASFFFLTSCGLCNRRFSPGRDIYMYRGDTAFCSMECREQQMKQDERKDKSNIKLPNSRNTESHQNHSEFPSAKSETSSNSETIAAA
ncbi:hypothetical protein K7X08_025306 [Anisodus acutangulus]|uniref:FLZ-type domain-containing protein n=1 Tax=Anisodus acutangulus TaxID=402998 RepID=A0A9Q1LTU2_9SOLA|nr:hypothetical protein K7X08_025306 [Anisodus acutangulus]